ncbi:cysteine desulfurase family protein [Paenibacillus methanolicus]|uniref:Cysteine desulfurase n=1 Tax=Paenibacillus methanolicus TaxID=582686 RepID=A0A5S5CF15_9BACL|nr:cysteine desulfurase family protein [Paenibacillus methanolicus]TYP77985.1 cysteine desulfurase [Paenibacillus methanolicus]
MHYFDHCASTPPKKEVVRTMAEVMERHYANPSSLHRAGLESAKLLARARAVIADAFGTGANHWTFTSGGTESNNMAILGAARQNKGRGRHLVTTRIEHASVYEAFAALEAEGFRVTYLPANEDGGVDAEQVEAALADDTILVSVMHVNNETGAVQPIEEIGKLLRGRRRTLFHVDGVQSAGKLPVLLQEWGIDLFTASAHKIGGPRGCGLLYAAEGVALAPILAGGGQESGRRPGTENVPAIVATAKAFRMTMEEQPERFRKMSELRRRLVGFLNDIPQLRLSGRDAVLDESGRIVMAPHIVHFSYPGMKPEVVIHMLEERGFLVSTQSACSSKSSKPSRVLEAMGMPRAVAASGIRVSFGDEHDEQAVEGLGRALRDTVAALSPLERKEGRIETT